MMMMKWEESEGWALMVDLEVWEEWTEWVWEWIADVFDSKSTPLISLNISII